MTEDYTLIDGYNALLENNIICKSYENMSINKNKLAIETYHSTSIK